MSADPITAEPVTARTPHWSRDELLRLLRSTAVMVAWAATLGLAFSLVDMYVHKGWIGVDTHAYWLAARRANPYQNPPGSVDGFEYSPVFHQLSRPLGLLPFPVCYALWASLEAAIFVILTRGIPWRWRGVVLVACVPELAFGNMRGLFSLVLVGTMAWPEAWALPILTKITPGGVGILWHVARGEVRHVVRAVGLTTALIGVSVLIQPHLWSEWLAYLAHHRSDHQLSIILRCAVAAILTVVAARLRRAWLLPIAFLISEPMLGGINMVLAMLPVTVYLYRRPDALLVSRRARAGVPA